MATDVYSMPDLTKKVRHRDGDRGQRRDTKDSGQLEERGEMGEIVDNDIYESVDDIDIVSGPQEDTRQNTAGRQSQGQRSNTVRRPLRVAAVCLGMLCLIQLGVITGLVVHYNSSNNNLIIERDQLESTSNNLTRERDQLQSRYDNMTLERDQLESTSNNLTLERDQLQSSYDDMTRERDQLQSRYEKLTMERDWTQSEAAVKSCPSGWMKFGCSCYYRSTVYKTWEESRKKCLTIGSDLVVINNKEEQEFLKGFNHDDAYAPWIGLKRTKGKWTWVDGTTLTTKYWASGEPGNNTAYNCARWGQGGWYSRTCSPIGIHKHNANGICEK